MVIHTKVCISSAKGVADSAVSIISLIELEMGSIFRFKYVFILFAICYSFLFIFSVSHDLYEEIPKTTCLPELNEKYEMITTAKFACANDPQCSGLVEAPKRRGQQRKFGEYSLTEREYILCSYPPITKATTDTLFLRKRGKLRINQHLNIHNNFYILLNIKSSNH